MHKHQRPKGTGPLTIPNEAVEAGNASAEVARAFANKEASKRALVARVLGIDSEVAARLGYGSAEQ